MTLQETLNSILARLAPERQRQVVEAPRLGLAYQLKEKTVIRAGYAHIFGPSNQAAQGTVGPFGFRTEYPWQSTIDGITPLNLLRNPYPLGFRPLPGAAHS